MREMVQSAVGLGFESLGFTGHAPQFFDAPYCMSPENERRYREEYGRLREEYGSRIRIWLGIERDYFSCADPCTYDYYIASVHYLPHHAQMTAVDGSPDCLARLLKDRYGGNGLKLAEEYYEQLALYALTRRPLIIGHLDLVKKYNRQLELFDEDSSDYRALVFQTLSVIHSSGSMLEVNTGAIARGHLTVPYPSYWILSAWKQLGGGIIVSSDCHDKDKLNYAFDRMPDTLRSLGYESVSVLGKGDTLFETLSLN